MKKYLDAGYDVDMAMLKSVTGFEQAVMSSDFIKADFMLVAGADINRPDIKGEPLLMRFKDRNTKRICYLVSRGANVNARNDGGETIIFKVADSWRFDSFYDQAVMLEMLVKNGSDINIPDYFGVTPLMRALERGRLDIMYQLLQYGYGADINAIDYMGESALFKTLRFTTNYAARLLIEYGIDINIQDLTGKTVLMRAMESKSYSKLIAPLLEEKNLDLSIRDYDGNSAKSLAWK